MLRPWVLVSLALLIINDHGLKGRGPEWLTGKLSDFAGLLFFPTLLLLISAFPSRAPLRPRRERLKLVVCCLVTGVVFLGVKVWPPATDAYSWALSILQWPWDGVSAMWAGMPLPPLSTIAVVRDPSDLWALSSVGLCFILSARRLAQTARRISPAFEQRRPAGR